jgi:putative transposase
LWPVGSGELDPKKSRPPVGEQVEERHALIAQAVQEQPHLPLTRLCSALGVSRSWYYESQLTQANPADENEADLELRGAVEELVLQFPGYGYRRVTKALARAGYCVNHKRVLRIMREESLLCQLKRRFVLTTNSNHSFRTYPNLLKELVLDAPDQAWQADITYIRLPTGFAYLAAVIDAFSRRCVGWQLSRCIDTNLTLAALDMALSARQVEPGLVHHSDRGVQYASSAYVARLENVGALASMSAKGSPYDNAKAESFFKTLKREEVYLKEYRTFGEAESNIGQFIEDVYNQKRLHSSLGYLPPVEFEALHYQTVGNVT